MGSRLIDGTKLPTIQTVPRLFRGDHQQSCHAACSWPQYVSETNQQMAAKHSQELLKLVLPWSLVPLRHSRWFGLLHSSCPQARGMQASPKVAEDLKGLWVWAMHTSSILAPEQLAISCPTINSCDLLCSIPALTKATPPMSRPGTGSWGEQHGAVSFGVLRDEVSPSFAFNNWYVKAMSDIDNA